MRTNVEALSKALKIAISELRRLQQVDELTAENEEIIESELQEIRKALDVSPQMTHDKFIEDLIDALSAHMQM